MKGSNGKPKRQEDAAETPAIEVTPPVVNSAVTPADSATTTIQGRRVEIDFTAHAVDQMLNRGVKKDEVLACLRSPDKRGLPTNCGRKRNWRCAPNTTRRGLNVVYTEPKPNRVLVVTVYYSGPP